MSDANTILREVKLERGRQDEKWGGPSHDDAHTVGDWARFIGQRVNELHSIPSAQRQRELLIEVAALAIAATEALDRLKP